jgi:hypothetical protein
MARVRSIASAELLPDPPKVYEREAREAVAAR